MSAKWENDFKADIPSHIVNSLASLGNDSSLRAKVCWIFNAVVCPKVLRSGSMVNISNIEKVCTVNNQRTDNPFGDRIYKIRSYTRIEQRIPERRQLIVQGAINFILHPIML